MAKEKQTKNINEKMKIESKNDICKDIRCPFHGSLKARGRIFRGIVIRKFPTRVVIEFERTVYVPKYERFSNSKTKLHAHLSDCLAKEIQVGDYIEIMECRPLSKIISFVVMKKIRSGEKSKEQNVEENLK